MPSSAPTSATVSLVRRQPITIGFLQLTKPVPLSLVCLAFIVLCSVLFLIVSELPRLRVCARVAAL